MWSSIVAFLTECIDFIKSFFKGSDKSDSKKVKSNNKNSFNVINSNNTTNNFYYTRKENDSKHTK